MDVAFLDEVVSAAHTSKINTGFCGDVAAYSEFKLSPSAKKKFKFARV